MRTTLSGIILVMLAGSELPQMFRADPVESSNVPVGSWGGEHISVRVTEKGAIFDLDCANGVIEDPLALDPRARFDCKGKYVREHGGDREGERQDAHPARFSGWSDGKKMMLVIKLTDTGQTIGEFTLVLWREPQLTKCL
jgi:hypothetical protein